MYSLMDGMIPIMIVLIIFTTVSAVAIVLILAALRRRKMEFETYKAAIDKGVPLPEMKFKSTVKSPMGTLRSGLVWLGAGLGFTIMMFFASSEDGDYTPMGLASIPVLIGVALIISYVIEKKEREKGKPEE
jgi:hypothetical protein